MYTIGNIIKFKVNNTEKVGVIYMVNNGDEITYDVLNSKELSLYKKINTEDIIKELSIEEYESYICK